MTRIQQMAALTVAAAVLATTGCAAGPAGTKAGGSPRPVTLRIGTDDAQGFPQPM